MCRDVKKAGDHHCRVLSDILRTTYLRNVIFFFFAHIHAVVYDAKNECFVSYLHHERSGPDKAAYMKLHTDGIDHTLFKRLKKTLKTDMHEHWTALLTVKYGQEAVFCRKNKIKRKEKRNDHQ